MITKYRHTGLVVNNLSKSRKFYCELLNFKIIQNIIEKGEYFNKLINEKNLKANVIKAKLPDNIVLELLEFINQFYEKKNSVEVYVYGAQGLGKTHVLQGAVLKALSENQNAIYIDCNDSLPEHILDSIDQLNLIGLDNVDVIKNDNQDFFFDLYNRARQAKVSILVSGSNMPADLSVMKDLKGKERNYVFLQILRC